MKRRLLICVYVSLWFTLAARAEVVDRIVAVVEGRIITLSDLRLEREIRVQLGEKPATNDLMLTKEMVDTYLIEKQIADYAEIDVTEEEINVELQKVTSRGVPVSSALRDAVRRSIRIQKFVDIKFRQLIRTTEDEIRKYYEDIFLPEARSRGLQPIPPLTDPEMAKAIQGNVIQETLDHEVDVWLQALRRRSNIEIFQ